MNNFAERLKELRKEKEITQMQLAFETNISKSAIANWELGISQPNSNAVIIL